MAHFYSSIQGSRGEATRCGTKNSGIVSSVMCAEGRIVTRIWHNEGRDRNDFEVTLEPHWEGGVTQVLARGICDARIDNPYVPALIA